MQSSDYRNVVTIIIASTNDHNIIELCVKSLFIHTGVSFRLIVLDSAEQYKRIPLLEGLDAFGAIDLLRRPGKLCTHDEALDEMVPKIKMPLFVTLDSDIEILREDWLEQLISAMDNSCDLVCAKEFTTNPDIVGDSVWLDPGGRKFTIWMSLYRTDVVRQQQTPFAHWTKHDGTTADGRRKMLYSDTGVDLYKRLREKGRVRELPSLFTDGYYHHWGSMSYSGYFERRLSVDPKAQADLQRQQKRYYCLIQRKQQLSADLCLERAARLAIS